MVQMMMEFGQLNVVVSLVSSVERLAYDMCHMMLPLRRHLHTLQKEPTTNQIQDIIGVRLSEPVSFIGVTDRSRHASTPASPNGHPRMGDSSGKPGTRSASHNVQVQAILETDFPGQFFWSLLSAELTAHTSWGAAGMLGNLGDGVDFMDFLKLLSYLLPDLKGLPCGSESSTCV